MEDLLRGAHLQQFVCIMQQLKYGIPNFSTLIEPRHSFLEWSTTAPDSARNGQRHISRFLLWVGVRMNVHLSRTATVRWQLSHARISGCQGALMLLHRWIRYGLVSYRDLGASQRPWFTTLVRAAPAVWIFIWKV